jgi:hypothetical protein
VTASLTALEELVREAVHEPVADVHPERLKSDVYRLRCTVDGKARSFVGKRHDPDIARRNELVARRWLPEVGLGDCGPPLLAVAAERDGSSVWHLYEDLGDCGLAPAASSPRIERAVAAIAAIHARFAGHALLPECRLWGGDLGSHFYEASVRDAGTALQAAVEARPDMGPERLALCNRLLRRLDALIAQRDSRADAIASDGGPETLLHGDLWPANVMIDGHPTNTRVRLIDWDHAAVGPVSYDLSSFLNRFPGPERMPILFLYEKEIARAGWELPSPGALNVLFETAELARIANRVIWPALAVRADDAGWAYAELAEVERWFAQLEPTLPLDGACAPS